MDDFLLERRAALERLCGEPPAGARRIGGGRNSRVYRLEGARGGVWALKAVLADPADPRDRLGTEFLALAFLRSQGLECLPEPLGRDPGAGLGLFSFVDGVPPLPPTAAEVEEACAFLAVLGRLGGRPGADGLPAASEACFTLEDLLDQLGRRLARLLEACPPGTEAGAFLRERLEPALERLGAAARRGTDPAAPLGRASRTLSPSDFGFHNALRTGAGLVFVDFEYFGWDDPAKTVADLLLHPGMDLPGPARERIRARLLEELPDPDRRLRARFERLFPLYGLKWCIILLNEFLPESLQRRRFAQAEEPAGARRARQLRRCRQMLESLAHVP